MLLILSKNVVNYFHLILLLVTNTVVVTMLNNHIVLENRSPTPVSKQ